MPTYKSPIKPFDPVLPLPGTSAFQYLRDNFYGAGQDSFTKPFGQNQELFELCQNVMPVSQGAFRLRYGYQLLVNPAIGAIKRIYPYQNIASGLRRLVYISGTAVSVSAEDGTSLSSILTSSNSNPRMVVSRDYAFFPSVIAPFTWPSGQKSDGKKWNSTGGLSDWGLAQDPSTVTITSTASAGNVTLVSTVGRVYAGAYQNSTTGHYSDLNVGVGSFTSNTAGPAFPSAESQSGGGAAWSNLTNINATDGAVASATLNDTSPTVSQTIAATGFGFAIPSTATIYGIAATVIKAAGNTNLGIIDNVVQLLKAGVSVGDNKADQAHNWSTSGLVSSPYGGSNDLWGATWTAADINAANFGISLGARQNGGLGNTAAQIDSVTLTITYATGAGANTGAITGKQISLSLPTSNPPAGVDKFAILATLDGGDTSTFYLLDTVPIAQTTYTDNTPDNVLVTKNRATEVDSFGIQHGLVSNQMPPLGLLFPTKHRGRIFGAISDSLWFSKNLDEITTSTGLVLGRYEEAWPPTYFLNVSTTKQTIQGLLSDGNTLYIGTERNIWRLDGDGPLNFSKPEIIFNEVGILNQDVWQVVFAEGQPVGMVWLTPDNRVILGNFAHYQDIGTPIQDVLATINQTATNGPWASFYSRREFDIYVLAIPTGSNNTPDTLCVYDMRGGKWFIWKPTDLLTSGTFNIDANGNPMWLIGASTGKIYQFLPTNTQDRVSDTPVAFTATIRTPWMHLGQPTMVKALNEIEVITGDSTMTVTVEGASKFSQVAVPNTVSSNGSLVNSPRGFFKLYLAGNTTQDRHYRFTFTSSNGTQDVLEGYIIEAFPIPY